MTSLTLLFRLATKARCPICQSDLEPWTTRFVDGVAFCVECYRDATVEAIGLEVDVLRYVPVPGSVCWQHGLLFWCPPCDQSRRGTCAQLVQGRLPKDTVVRLSLYEHAGKRTERPLEDPCEEPRTRDTRYHRTSMSGVHQSDLGFLDPLP